MDTSELESWSSENFVLLVLVAIGLIALYLLSDWFVHRAVRRTLKATDTAMQDTGVDEAEPESAPSPSSG